MVGWIKMKLGTQVGIGPGHTVLDADPAPFPQRGTAPNFRLISGEIDQDAAWYGCRLRAGDFVLDGDPVLLPKKGAEAPPQFLVHVYCGQTAGWFKMALRMEVGLGPGHIVLDGDPAPPPQKGHSPPSDF